MKWLGMGLPMGRSEWLPLYHLGVFLTLILLFLYFHLTVGKEGREVNEQPCDA